MMSCFSYLNPPYKSSLQQTDLVEIDYYRILLVIRTGMFLFGWEVGRLTIMRGWAEVRMCGALL